jgi:hypothetical protein
MDFPGLAPARPGARPATLPARQPRGPSLPRRPIVPMLAGARGFDRYLLERVP